MIIKKRFVNLPNSVIEISKSDPLIKDLYLCELSELLMSNNFLWEYPHPLENHLLIYCTKGSCTINISRDKIEMREEQFCIIPANFKFQLITKDLDPTAFITCQFNGDKSKILEQDFTVVRNLMPSVNNLIANRKMLFDELFNNSARGYHLSNMYYINFTFAHLLATFVYASKNSDDILKEENPIVLKTIKFLELNIHKKLSLHEIADEVGYSETYLSTIFKKGTNYSPLSYFSHLKISRACEYLDQTHHKIKQIAFILGYSDPYYFSKTFQKSMGISPRAYRNRIHI